MFNNKNLVTKITVLNNIWAAVRTNYGHRRMLSVKRGERFSLANSVYIVVLATDSLVSEFGGPEFSVHRLTYVGYAHGYRVEASIFGLDFEQAYAVYASEDFSGRLPGSLIG